MPTKRSRILRIDDHDLIAVKRLESGTVRLTTEDEGSRTIIILQPNHVDWLINQLGKVSEP